LLSIFYGLVSALSWGAADFTGGVASRRTNVYGVVIGAEGVGVVFCILAALVMKEPIPGWQTWAWGSAAGLCGGIGLLLLYQAFSRGRMSIAAPVSAVVGAVIPVIVGSLVDGLPTVWTFIGMLLALLAVGLIARGESGATRGALRLNEISLPLIAGLFFGLYFVFMHQAGNHGFLWPILAARLASALSILAAALFMRQPWAPPRKLWPMIALSGFLDVIGNGFYVLAGQVGRMDVAAVLGSLYPGSTVLLAGVFLRERLGRMQVIGVITALVAILLMTI